MISVCMATYNGEKFIKEQLETILGQLGKDDEVVISDDGSNDDTKAIIDSLEDERIRYYENKGTHGFTHNFENALRLSKGDYIFLSDQDDIWVENKVETVMKYLKSVDFVIHDCVTVDADMNILSESRFSDFNVKPGFLSHLIKSRYLGCCMAFNRQLLNVALPFPQRDDLVEHDIWLAAVGFLYFKSKLIYEPLIKYRRHGNNVSDGGFTKGYSWSNKIYRRIYRLRKLTKIKKNAKNIRIG